MLENPLCPTFWWFLGAAEGGAEGGTADALEKERFDSIIVVTLPQKRCRWLRRDLSSRFRRQFPNTAGRPRAAVGVRVAEAVAGRSRSLNEGTNAPGAALTL